MPCSHCKGSGHNKRTCPNLGGGGGGGGGPPCVKKLTPTRVKKQLSQVKIPELEEAEVKLKIIERERPEQYKIANECAQSLMDGKNVMVNAEEKTGKRCILEAINLIMIINHYSDVPYKREKVPRSVYVTGLNRKDTKVQFEEQENEYGILSISSGHDKLLGDIINILNDELNDGNIYIHLDECDYGTGADQSLSKLYNSQELQLHKDRIKYVAYSATPQELEFSELNSDEWNIHTFKPSDRYFGAQKYLDRELVYQPEIFFNDTDIREHGKSILEDLRTRISGPSDLNDIPRRQRNVIVVRDTTRKNLEAIQSKKDELSEKHGCEIHIFNQNNSFEWGDKTKWSELGRIEIKDDNEIIIGYQYNPVIICISHICTRSTEICPLGHRKIFAWHDVRKLEDKKAYNTLSQAIGRIKHYSQEDHPDNTIRLYCDRDILNYTVGNELKTKSLVLGQRINSMKEKQSKVKFVGYEDSFGDDPSSVPDPAWQHGDPSIGRTGIEFCEYNGKWCHYDKKIRIWGDKPPGSTNHTQEKTVLQYESKSSDRYIIRMAKYEKIELVEPTKPTYTHQTKATSMYVSK
jgi:hypothetical protein